MKLSRFYHCVQVDDNMYAIYNSLIMEVLYVTFEEKIEIETLRCKNPKLFKVGVYVNNEEKDLMLLEEAQRIYSSQNKKVSVLYIITSTCCNLACTYCFEERSMFNNCKEENLSVECLLNFMTQYMFYAIKNNIKKCKIIFYGGEPTVNWKVIEETIRFSKNYNNFFEFSMVSNGTLLDNQKIDFLVANNVSIAISIDGPKILNDKNRMFRISNESVYDKVIRTIVLLKKKHANYNLSITISNNLLNMQTDFFNWLEKLEVKNLFYNIMHFTYFENENVWKRYYERASEFIVESFERFYPQGIYDGRVLKKITPLIKKDFLFADCASVGVNQLTLKPNGDICVCHGYVKTDRCVIGNINRNQLDNIISKKENNDWCKLSPIFNNKCLECESLFICGGGCPVQSEALFGDVDKIDLPYCIYTKKILRWILGKFK